MFDSLLCKLNSVFHYCELSLDVINKNVNIFCLANKKGMMAVGRRLGMGGWGLEDVDRPEMACWEQAVGLQPERRKLGAWPTPASWVHRQANSEASEQNCPLPLHHTALQTQHLPQEP